MNKKDRIKEIGEVFTPENIVEEMITSIPDEIWANQNKTILEPTCGEGIFIIKIIKKRLSLGIDIEQAIKTIYGLDIMKDNIQKCKENVLKIAYREIKKQKLSKEESEIKLARIMSIVDHNIRLTEDTLKENFEEFEEWEDIKTNREKYLSFIRENEFFK